MFEQLKKENFEKYEANTKKRTQLAQEIGNAPTIEAARELLPKMKALKEELKEIDEEHAFINQYADLFKTNPEPSAPIKAKKGIGLT